jgi:phenylacetate-CoA ligase
VTEDHAALQSVTSGIKGIAWPPLTGSATPALPALVQQLETTQWLTAGEIAAAQFRQLREVAAHAEKYSPHFRTKLQAAGIQAQHLADAEGLHSLPPLSRRELQSCGEDLFCRQLPQAHAPVTETRSSGSTGLTVVVRRTAINQLFWLAHTLREHLWHRRDFSGKLAVIRPDPAMRTLDLPNWGPPVSLLFDSGSSHAIPLATDVAQQADWLVKTDPDYLLTFPTNLSELAYQFEQHDLRLNRLRQIRSIGEMLTDDIRATARRVFHTEIADTYSSQEVGIVAVQCPHSGLYHVMAESLLLELLDDNGKPCAPGEIGRIVISDLHNFATPLIRYDIGDYAEAGPVCSCGRGLPTLKRIMGRQRNMLRLPDGRRYWPLTGSYRYREIAPIRQFQLIQRSLELVEVRLVSDAPVTPAQELQLTTIIHEWMGYPFCLKFVYFDSEIPRGSGGKFEEFISEVG